MNTLETIRILQREIPPRNTPEDEIKSYYDISGHQGSVLCLQYDSKILVTGSSDHSIIIWSIPDYKPIHLSRHHVAEVLDVSFDDKYITTCSKDGNICILDRRDPQFALLRTIPASRGTVNSLHLKRGIIASAGVDSVVRIWHAETGKRIMSFHGHDRGLACVQISSDKKYVVSGGNDNKIRIWDLKGKRPLAILEGHESLVRSLHINGRKSKCIIGLVILIRLSNFLIHVVISGSYDQSIKVWDFDLSAPLLDLKGFHSSWVFAAKADCKRIVSTSYSSDVVLFDFTDGLDATYLPYFRSP